MHPVILLALLVGLLLGISWLRRAPPAQRQELMKKLVIWGGLGLLVLLTLTGRVHWLFVALGGVAALAQRAFTAYQVWRTVKNIRGAAAGAGATDAGAGPRSGRVSEVSSRYLRMRLDHDTGEMSGEVLTGRFEGHSLDALSLEALVALLQAYRADDPQSAALLETYLDRTHGDAWRDRIDEEATRRTGEAPGGPMTREEAYEVLGLAPGAGREDIVDAHRRLIQKLHPDRGGSSYLAAKINQAKDLLLGG